jgi:Ca2+-dependent lipid-binding protein
VHIIEARDLKGRDFGAISDPVVIVECLGKKKSTKIHKKALNVMFDEVLVFKFTDKYPAEIESGKITIRCNDANTIRRDVLIGIQIDILK